MKLMILDGNSIVNRAFYGIRMLNAPDGTPTNAVYGFLTIFQRILELEQPQAVCVAFDVHAPTFRHEQYAPYKAQRKPMPEELVVQMPLLKQTLDHMGIRRLELAGLGGGRPARHGRQTLRGRRLGVRDRHRRQGQPPAHHGYHPCLPCQDPHGPDGDDRIHARSLPRRVRLRPRST